MLALAHSAIVSGPCIAVPEVLLSEPVLRPASTVWGRALPRRSWITFRGLIIVSDAVNTIHITQAASGESRDIVQTVWELQARLSGSLAAD